MSLTTTPTAVSYQFEEGFTSRLDEVMELCGLRRHGRKTILAQVTGLTLGGVSRFQEQDRPPKDSSLNAIADFLARELSTSTSQPISAESVKAYLLIGNTEDPYLASLLTTPHSGRKLEYDPVYSGEVILRIREIAHEMGIDMNTPGWLGKGHIIDKRFVKYCHTNRPALDSPEFIKLVRSMIIICDQDHTLLT